MKPKKILMAILTCTTGLTVTLPMTVHYIILYYLKQVDLLWIDQSLTCAWETRKGSWFDELMDGYHGSGWGNHILLNDNLGTPVYGRTLKHEDNHVFWQKVLGILMPVLYLLFMLFILAFLWSKHSYYDNPFERSARRAAGQQLDIPKSKWADGPEDRWLFW